MSHSSPCDVCEIHGSFPVTTCSIILRFLQRLPILGCRGITMWHTWSCAPQSLVSRWHAGGSTFCWSERNWFGIQQCLNIDTWQQFFTSKWCRLRSIAQKSISSDDLFQEKAEETLRAIHKDQPCNTIEVCNPQFLKYDFLPNWDRKHFVAPNHLDYPQPKKEGQNWCCGQIPTMWNLRFKKWRWQRQRIC